MAHSFITCSFCGKREDIEVFRRMQSPLVSKMRAEQLCFDCAFWKTWLSRPEPGTVVISGTVYKPSRPFEQGDLRKAKLPDTLYIIDAASNQAYFTRGLLSRGSIPPLFRKDIPDQYKFITRDEYRRIYHYGAGMCLSKGCFDRYRCIWYRADIAEPKCPWNTIPKDYIIGSELCPSFVDKNGKRNV